MTRQEFLDYATENNYHNKERQSRLNDPRYIEWYNTSSDWWRELEDKRNQKIVYTTGDRIDFFRPETASDDILFFDILGGAATAEFAAKSDFETVYIGRIEGLAGAIEDLFLSKTDGCYYNHKHRILAQTEEEFFDYITTVEFDFHPVISERTYEILREGGWYEGRRIDLTEFIAEMSRRGIVLTRAQLDFISEWSGVGICGSEHTDYSIYTLEELLQCNRKLIIWGRDDILFPNRDRACEDSAILEAVRNEGPSWFLEPNGLLGYWRPLGRTPLECINNLVKDSYNIREPDDPQNSPKGV